MVLDRTQGPSGRNPLGSLISSMRSLDLCLAFVNMRPHCRLSCLIWQLSPSQQKWISLPSFLSMWEVAVYFLQLMAREGSCGGHCWAALWTTAPQKVADKDSRNFCSDDRDELFCLEKDPRWKEGIKPLMMTTFMNSAYSANTHTHWSCYMNQKRKMNHAIQRTNQ